MLARMCGWNEPERVNVQSVEIKVDAALIEELRAGYAEMGAIHVGQSSLRPSVAANVTADSEANGNLSGPGPTPPQGSPQNPTLLNSVKNAGTPFRDRATSLKDSTL